MHSIGGDVVRGSRPRTAHDTEYVVLIVAWRGMVGTRR